MCNSFYNYHKKNFANIVAGYRPIKLIDLSFKSNYNKKIISHFVELLNKHKKIIFPIYAKILCNYCTVQDIFYNKRLILV